LSGSCGGDESPESGFSWTAPRTGVYRFSSEGSRYPTVLYLRAETCDGAELGCGDTSVTTELAAGQRVVAVVDGQGGAQGEFFLGITEATCPGGDLGSLLGTPVFSRIPPGRGPDLGSHCGTSGTRQVSLGWRAPAAASYTFTASGSDFDPVVSLRGTDCRGPELGCGTASATVILGAGEPVVVVLGGASLPSDHYQLGVTSSTLKCAESAGLCHCDDHCAERGDCCVDAPCPACPDGRVCEFGQCTWPHCSGGLCPDCQRCAGDRCEPAPDGQSCDDGDACTAPDACMTGVCQAGPVVCDGGISSPPDREAGLGSHLAVAGGACSCSVPARRDSKGALGLVFALVVTARRRASRSARKG
jgi:hypothetical protein